MVPDGSRVVLVDDWMETASQMTAALDLLEAAGANVVHVAVLGAEENETPLELEAEYGVHSVSVARTRDARTRQRRNRG